MEKIKDAILKFLRLDSLINNLTGYVEARVALIKVELREEVAGVLSRGLMIMLVVMVGFLFILFVALGLAQYLNAVLASTYAGYAFVALFFGVLLVALMLLRKSFFKAFEKQFAEMIKNKTN